MFLFKKLLSPFILPPGLFVVLLAAGGVWLRSRKRGGGGGFCLAVGVLIWLSAVSPVADALTGRLESGLSIPENVGGDVILLLGGGVVQGVPDMSGLGRPTDGMLARIVTAVRLQKRLDIPIVVSGGRVWAHETAEARVAARFLVDLGVPSERIILEENSRDTRENAAYSRRICEQHGFRKPILVTSAFHLKRAMLSYRQAGLAVAPFPAAFRTHPGKAYHWDDFLPNPDCLEQTAAALKEYIGMFFYRLAYSPNAGQAQRAAR
jgi:uncharacterized SAM-binding protein YcdF (DUF218 family)